ncbi:MAG: Y-family DNA polymerase [Rhodothermales bacterium]
MIGLADCNNFYASCEQHFQPRLRNRPVVVLSNNDGNIIARSAAAKAMGVSMAEPYFKVKDELEQMGCEVFSSNYALYQDMSDRVHTTLQMVTPEVESYSIDEAFVGVPGHTTPTMYANTARRKVWEWTGVPISIGMASTKTRAKLANHIAKRADWTLGVLDMEAFFDPDRLLDNIAVGEVWGIGPKRAKLLADNRIFSAKDLRDADTRWIKQRLTVMGLRTVLELRGQVCYPLSKAPGAQQRIMASGSFGQRVYERSGVEGAIAHHAARAARKLRGQGLQATQVFAFLTTGHYGRGPHYGNGHTLKLPLPTAYTPTITQYALQGLRRIWRRGYGYKKAGVMVQGLKPRGGVQADAFVATDSEQEGKLMEAIDAINGKYGRGTVHLGRVQPKRKQVWAMNQARRSPRYTTRMGEVLTVRA